MNFKLIGAVCIIAGCGSIGFLNAMQYRKYMQFLSQLSEILGYMERELRYHGTSLPELCRQAGACGTKEVHRIFLSLADELDTQIKPEVSLSMHSVLEKCGNLDVHETEILMILGRSLGKFDAHGQLEGLENVKQICQMKFEQLMQNKENRLRSYQTLGLCAGAAVAILLV